MPPKFHLHVQTYLPNPIKLKKKKKNTSKKVFACLNHLLGESLRPAITELSDNIRVLSLIVIVT